MHALNFSGRIMPLQNLCFFYIHLLCVAVSEKKPPCHLLVIKIAICSIPQGEFSSYHEIPKQKNNVLVMKVSACMLLT